MSEIEDRVIDNIRHKSIPVLWAVSVVTQDPESNDLFHAMGQLVAFSTEEDKARQFVIGKAMEKFPLNKLISCKAIPIAEKAMLEVLKK